MSPFDSRFSKYLATGEYVATEDAKPPRTPRSLSLLEHDARFHPDGYKEGDRCLVREQLKINDKNDLLISAENQEKRLSRDFPVGARFVVVPELLGSFEKKRGWTSGVITGPKTQWGSYRVRFDDGTEAVVYGGGIEPEASNTGTFEKKEISSIDDLSAAEKKEKEENAISFKVGSKGDPERGRQAIIDGPGAGYLATLEREVAEGKTEGLEGEKERCRHYIENGKDDAEKQLHRDALAFLEELGKKAEKKNIPASKAFEPRFDMSKESLYGYGKTDPSAKDAATLAATFNQRAGWGFADDEVQAYFDAFKDMDAGKVPKLPDLDGKTYEPPMDTKWNGPQQALAAIFQKRPDLIRPYIVERLEDAGFSSEVKELRSGAYKKRTKPYDAQKEDEERQRRQMAQDAAAAKYLKEC